MKVGFIYPNIFGFDGYPRDIRRLLDELTVGGHLNVHPVPASPLEGYSAKSPISEWLIFRELCARFQEFDRVHFFGFFFAGYPLLARFMHSKGIPYRISPLAALLPHELAVKPTKKKLFLHMGGLDFLRRAEMIHTFTQNEVLSIRALGISTPCLKSPLGIYFEDVPFGMDGLVDEIAQPYLLCMGRLAMCHKGIDLALDGFAEYLRTGGRKYKLVIAGRSWFGSHDDIRKRILDLEIKDQVIFLGEVTTERKFALMKHCSAFLYPTRHDGPPRPIRDALALGRRLLITHEANIEDNIEVLGWGYQFPPEKAAIAAAINQLDMELVTPVYVDPASVLGWAKLAKEFAAAYPQ